MNLLTISFKTRLKTCGRIKLSQRDYLKHEVSSTVCCSEKMINVKKFLIFFVPTTVFGFTLFWWRKWKATKPHRKAVEKENVEKACIELTTEVVVTPVLEKESRGKQPLEDDSIVDWRLSSSDSATLSLKKPIVEEEIIPTKENQGESYKKFDVSEDSFLSPTKSIANESRKKRVRHQSSCDADSAFTEDYSSDNISISSTDNAKSNQDLSEDSDVNEKCRNWYGPALQSVINEEEEVINWGSIPMSDTECNYEETLYSLSSTSTDDWNLKSVVTSTKKEKKHTPKKSPRKYARTEKHKKVIKEENVLKNKKSPQKTKTSKKSSPQKKSIKEGIEGSWRVEKPMISKDFNTNTVDYQFPEEFCGRLIGKSGKHIMEIKQKTGASICIEPELRKGKRIVSIYGNVEQIKKAQNILNNRFNNSLVVVPEINLDSVISGLKKTTLPVDCVCECIVTAVVDVGHFFVQIFNEDVDRNIIQLQQELASGYANPRNKYIYSEMPSVGDYCVGCIDYTWCRLKVVEVHPENQVTVAFVDYGGNVTVPLEILLKIRPDLLELPVQAVECFLSNICPHKNKQEYSYDATNVFGQLVEGKALQANVKGEVDGVVCVELSYMDVEREEVICVNNELVKWGLVSVLAS